jgi:DNA-binding MarR family transcriptional regulator
MPSSESGRTPEPWGILAGLWQLMQSVMDDSAPALEALGLTPKAFFLLAAVEVHPFPAELARMMHLPPPTVTYMVKQMEARGFLKRQADPGDLRKFRLVLTADGRKAIRRGRESIGAVMGRRLDRLERGEIDSLDRVIARLTRPAPSSGT